jgi:hypothetical protein
VRPSDRRADPRHCEMGAEGGYRTEAWPPPAWNGKGLLRQAQASHSCADCSHAGRCGSPTEEGQGQRGSAVEGGGAMPLAGEGRVGMSQLAGGERRGWNGSLVGEGRGAAPHRWRKDRGGVAHRRLEDGAGGGGRDRHH